MYRLVSTTPTKNDRAGDHQAQCQLVCGNLSEPLDMVIQRQTNAEEEADAEEAEEPLSEGNKEGAPIVDLGANARVMGPHRVRPTTPGTTRLTKRPRPQPRNAVRKLKFPGVSVPMISFQRSAATIRNGTRSAIPARSAATIDRDWQRPYANRLSLPGSRLPSAQSRAGRKHDPGRNGADPCGNAMKDAFHERRLVKAA